MPLLGARRGPDAARYDFGVERDTEFPRPLTKDSPAAEKTRLFRSTPEEALSIFDLMRTDDTLCA